MSEPGNVEKFAKQTAQKPSLQERLQAPAMAFLMDHGSFTCDEAHGIRIITQVSNMSDEDKAKLKSDIAVAMQFVVSPEVKEEFTFNEQQMNGGRMVATLLPQEKSEVTEEALKQAASVAQKIRISSIPR